MVVAEFGRAHGVRGELRLKSWTADPAAVAGYSPLVLADGREIVITGMRPAPGGEHDMFVVSVQGVADRAAAEALARQRLFMPRGRLPQLEDEDEFYLADLVGLAVETAAGERLGEVVAVHDFGAGDVVEIRPPASPGNPRRSTAMVAFTRDFVPVVDIAGGRLVVSVNPFAKDGDSRPEPDDAED
ncbi:ribosome maturation factor RimM [Camelimonas abortus]|uniref:Ribosome maturation factor RimM n=1 Tax=Camelimonas abortus TaxID=1017184 RepID=A0ABV7LCU4_9HYPH